MGMIVVDNSVCIVHVVLEGWFSYCVVLGVTCDWCVEVCLFLYCLSCGGRGFVVFR